MTISLVLDVVVIVLLVPTIVFAVLLNGRLATLRRNRDDLARMIAAFNEATTRAEGGIPRLRKAGEETGQALQEKIERTQMLRDDLAFMIERAAAMADRLEAAVRTTRDVLAQNGGILPPEAANPSSFAGSGPGNSSLSGPSLSGPSLSGPSLSGMDIESAAAAAERTAARLARQTAAVPRETETSSPSAAEPQAPSRTSRHGQLLGQPLGQPLGMALAASSWNQEKTSTSLPASPPPSPSPSAEEKSEAEQELLRALRSVR